MKLYKTEEKDVKEENKQDNKKVSKFVDKKTAKKVFANLIIAVLIMAYFCIISSVYDNVQETGIIKVLKISTMVFLGIALILIEFTFKRESKTLLIHTFEALAIAVHSLTIVYITRVFTLDFKGYVLVTSYIFSIYYVLKAIIINTKARKEYLNGLSDISDIVKKEEPTKKEAFKKEKKETVKKEKKEKRKKQKAQEEKMKKDIIVNNEIDADEKQEKIEEVSPIIEEPKEEKTKFKNNKLAEIRAKLRELQKQDEELKGNIEKKEEKKEKQQEEPKEEPKEQIEQAPKRKRGRPKKEVKEETKVEKKDNNNNDEKQEKEQIEQAPKRKRGRPKKEVKKDD